MNPKCIKCGKGEPGLIVINVRDKLGWIQVQKHVHGPCYHEDPEWVKKQVHGINPRFHFINTLEGKK